jgi:BirA family biotin operon repressor/biotin-[acetyl-CoA-carboxylase] ligase
VWQSPPGNLHLSVLLRPACPPADAGQLGMVAALSVADLLRGLGIAPRLKWPNDVLVDGAKIAGVLVETGLLHGRVDWAVVGIGLNLAWSPQGLDYPATSVAEALAAAAPPPPQPSPASRERGRADAVGTPSPARAGEGRGGGGAAGPELLITNQLPTPTDLAPALLTHLAARYATWRTEGFAPLRTDWRALGPTPGAPARVRIGATQVSGAFRDLDPDGALVLELAPGRHRRILAGDVISP